MESTWGDLARSLLSKGLIALAGAIFGYFVGYVKEHRQYQIQRVSEQISNLYGPLRAEMEVNTQTWKDFRAARFPSRASFFDGTPRSQAEIDLWRDFMRNTFQPQNQKMSDIIANHAYLFVDGKTPSMFIFVVAHAEAYKAVMSRWPQLSTNLERNRTAEVNTTLVNFPDPSKLLACLNGQIVALERVRNRLRNNPTSGLIDTVHAAVPPVCREPTVVAAPAG